MKNSYKYFIFVLMLLFTIAISPSRLVANETMSYQKTGMSRYEIENEPEKDKPAESEEKENPYQYSPESPYGDVYDPDNPYAEWEK